MTGFWLISYIALWLFVIILSVFVIGILQQVGVQAKDRSDAQTSDRSTEPFVPDPDEGPSLGSSLLNFEVVTSNGYGSFMMRSSESGTSDKAKTLLICMTPLCSGCQLLVNPLNELVDSAGFPGRVIIVLRAESSECESFLSVFPCHMPVICSQARDILKALDVHGTPFGLYYDEEGVLIRKGLIRTPDKLHQFLNVEAEFTYV